MGSIYSDALQVVSWLGMPADFPGFVDDRQRFQQQVDEVKLLLVDVKRLWFRGDLVHDLSNDEIDILMLAQSSNYWDRAWIVRELALARYVSVWSSNRSCRLEELVSLGSTARIMSILYQRVVSPSERLLTWFEHRIPSYRRKHESLCFMLQRNIHKQCAIPADRIYSLLDLVREGDEIFVDYSRSRASLLIHALEACRNSFCLCLGWNLMLALCMVDHVMHFESTSQEFDVSYGDNALLTVVCTGKLSSVNLGQKLVGTRGEVVWLTIKYRNLPTPQ